VNAKVSLSAQQAADELGLSRPTVTELIRRGDLPATDVSASPNRPRFRLSPDDVRAFIERHRVGVSA